MAESLSLRFEGPFSWTGERTPLLAKSPLARSAGVYLWTVQTTVGELVQYVGETGRTFARRFEDHLRAQLAGQYRLLDPAALRQGRALLLSPGIYGPGVPRSVAPFAARLTELAAPLAEYIVAVRFYLAPAELPIRLRRRVEAAIAGHLAGQAGPAGTLLDPGVRYHSRLPSEEPVEVRLSVTSALHGLPESLMA